MDDGRARKLLTQIEAFETKVRTSQDSFLGRKLKDFLPELKSKSDVDYVDSIATLRKLVKKKSDEIDSITETSNYNDNKIVVYFKWFLDFHSYLKALKESFDGRVHKHLLQYFYDSPYASSPDKSIPSTESSGYASSLERQMSLISLTSSSGSHDVHPALKDVYQEFIELSAGVDEERINKLAERLFVTSRQLQRLLREDIPIRQLILSSYQSKHNETTDDGNYIVILLEKIFKIFAASAKQAKQWVQLDTVKSVHLHLARQRFKEMHKTLTARIRELDGIIDGIQREIDNESEGLHKLVKREERASDINSKLFEMDDNISQREDELKNTETELASIKSQLHKIDINDYQERKRLETELEASKMQVDNIARDIEAKKYCKRLLEEDLQVEMQIKPSMIRFTNNVQEKCETLETNLSKHRRERAALLDFIEKLRVERQRVESEILRQAMLISSLDHDIAKHRPSIVPPLSPSLDSPPPKGRFIDLSSSMEST